LIKYKLLKLLTINRKISQCFIKTSQSQEGTWEKTPEVYLPDILK